MQIRDRPAGITVVHVVVVQVAVVTVEDPRVVHVVPLSKPSVRAVGATSETGINDTRAPFYLFITGNGLLLL